LTVTFGFVFVLPFLSLWIEAQPSINRNAHTYSQPEGTDMPFAGVQIWIWERAKLKYAVLNLPYSTGSSAYSSSFSPLKHHPIYAWMGMRPALAQHTSEEHSALARWASVRSTVVEIGVAEGVSAIALRQGMAADGRLYLIDPFHVSRNSILNFTKRTAHRLVRSVPRGSAVWIESFSFDAVQSWTRPIDLLFIDGDHTDQGVRRDWNEWNRFVVPGGIVIFHDARIFDGGWTSPDYGPVKLVNDLFRPQSMPGWRIAEEMHSLVVVERLW
jgi:hypothetical protein